MQNPQGLYTGQIGGQHRPDRSGWDARDEQHPRVNSPNPTPDLPNHSTVLYKTLRIVGTPQGHSIAKIWCTKTCQNERNRRNPTKNASNPRAKKTPKSTPLLTDLGVESKGKELRRVQAYIPHQIPKIKASKSFNKIVKKGLRKSPKRTNGKDTSKPLETMPNHLYIPKRFIQGLTCHLIILLSHKISP
jgi:hypothetical protein